MLLVRTVLLLSDTLTSVGGKAGTLILLWSGKQNALFLPYPHSKKQISVPVAPAYNFPFGLVEKVLGVETWSGCTGGHSTRAYFCSCPCGRMWDSVVCANLCTLQHILTLWSSEAPRTLCGLLDVQPHMVHLCPLC